MGRRHREDHEQPAQASRTVHDQTLTPGRFPGAEIGYNHVVEIPLIRWSERAKRDKGQ
jgi:hypothetical protein